MDLTPETGQLRHARAVLARLADQPGDAAYPATVALAALESVHPPYPPSNELPPGVTTSVDDVLQALQAAIDAAEEPDTAVRLAEAAILLRPPPPS